LGSAARAKAQLLYDWDTIGRQVVTTYARLLQDQRDASRARQR